MIGSIARVGVMGIALGVFEKGEVQSRLVAASRLQVLKSAAIMDTNPEPAFDRITRLICRLLQVDISLVSLVDAERQFFKSSSGLPAEIERARGTPLSHSFCQYVVSSESALVVSDAREHVHLASNLAIRDLNVIAYAGVPIRSDSGEILGSLCAIHHTPRTWQPAEIEALQDFAHFVEDAIRLRRLTNGALSLAEQSETIAKEYNHRANNALSVASSLMALCARNASSVEELASAVRSRLMALGQAYGALLRDRSRAPIGEVIGSILSPFKDGNIEIVPGKAVTLSENWVTPVSLLIHELATNSAKYGAIGNGGKLVVAWEGDDEATELSWREETAEEPFSQEGPAGFGTQLLKITERQSGEPAVRQWRDGVFYLSIRIPDDSAAPAGHRRS